MRSSSSLLGRGLFWIAYGSTSKRKSLEESLTRIRVLRVFRGFFLVACGKKSFILTNKKRKIYGKIWMVSVLFVYLQLQK